MGFLDRFKPRRVEEANPWETQAQPQQPTDENPWKNKGIHISPAVPRAADVWKAPTRIGKNWVLHKLAFAVILLNVGLGLFFTSNNPQFNAALYLYLGASTLLLGHYWGMTRSA